MEYSIKILGTSLGNSLNVCKVNLYHGRKMNFSTEMYKDNFGNYITMSIPTLLSSGITGNYVLI